MADLERTYTVPLRKGFVESARHRRTKKAISVLKIFLKKHFKADDVKLGEKLNEKMWEKGKQNPPCKVVVTGVKDSENVVRAELKGFKFVDKRKKEEVKEEGIKARLAEKLGVKPGKKKAGKEEEDKKGGGEKKEEVKAEKKEAGVKKEGVDSKEEKKEEVKAEKKDDVKKEVEKKDSVGEKDVKQDSKKEERSMGSESKQEKKD